MYRPLREVFPESVDLGACVTPQLFALHVVASEEETLLDAAIPSLSPPAGEEMVPAQPDDGEAPYPRWISCDRRTPVPLANVLGTLFPHHVMPAFAHAPVRALVAGCGTANTRSTLPSNISFLSSSHSMPVARACATRPAWLANSVSSISLSRKLISWH